MTTPHANWDDNITRIFLDLVIGQKNRLHWNQKGLTTIRWANVYPAFREVMKLPYDKKQLQNKFNELKRAFFNWRDLQTHTGLGRDPSTGGITADPLFFRVATGY